MKKAQQRGRKEPLGRSVPEPDPAAYHGPPTLVPNPTNPQAPSNVPYKHGRPMAYTPAASAVAESAVIEGAKAETAKPNIR